MVAQDVSVTMPAAAAAAAPTPVFVPGTCIESSYYA